MNRLIANRHKIKMVKTNLHTINVDNYNDLQRARKAMKKDRCFKLYHNVYQAITVNIRINQNLMSPWWMVSPGPKRQLIPTIKKKFYTFSNLIVKRNYTLIIKTIKHDIATFRCKFERNAY